MCWLVPLTDDEGSEEEEEDNDEDKDYGSDDNGGVRVINYDEDRTVTNGIDRVKIEIWPAEFGSSRGRGGA